MDGLPHKATMQENFEHATLASAKFADLLIPLELFDPAKQRLPSFQNFYIPERKISVPSMIAPVNYLSDINGLRDSIATKYTAGNEIKAFHDYGGARYRISSFYDVARGDFVACRKILSPLPKFREIKGLKPKGVEFLLDLVSPAAGRGGLVLFAGKSGVGKTTTMFSALRECLIRYGGVAYTVENPTEIPMSGYHKMGNCFQIDASKSSMAKEIAEVRRRGNNYLLVGEIQYPDEAMEVVQAALDGTVVFATTHGNNIIGALERLVSILASRSDKRMALSNLSQGLLAVIHQKRGRFDETGDWTFSSEMLFVGEGSTVPGVISNGELSILQDDIFTQNQKLTLGSSPI